jgi:hypothetical protein
MQAQLVFDVDPEIPFVQLRPLETPAVSSLPHALQIPLPTSGLYVSIPQSVQTGSAQMSELMDTSAT